MGAFGHGRISFLDTTAFAGFGFVCSMNCTKRIRDHRPWPSLSNTQANSLEILRVINIVLQPQFSDAITPMENALGWESEDSTVIYCMSQNNQDIHGDYETHVMENANWIWMQKRAVQVRNDLTMI